jgi:hypothetical protein
MFSEIKDENAPYIGAFDLITDPNKIHWLAIELYF